MNTINKIKLVAERLGGGILGQNFVSLLLETQPDNVISDYINSIPTFEDVKNFILYLPEGSKWKTQAFERLLAFTETIAHCFSASKIGTTNFLQIDVLNKKWLGLLDTVAKAKETSTQTTPSSAIQLQAYMIWCNLSLEECRKSKNQGLDSIVEAHKNSPSGSEAFTLSFLYWCEESDREIEAANDQQSIETAIQRAPRDSEAYFYGWRKWDAISLKAVQAASDFNSLTIADELSPRDGKAHQLANVRKSELALKLPIGSHEEAVQVCRMIDWSCEARKLAIEARIKFSATIDQAKADYPVCYVFAELREPASQKWENISLTEIEKARGLRQTLEIAPKCHGSRAIAALKVKLEGFLMPTIESENDFGVLRRLHREIPSFCVDALKAIRLKMIELADTVS